MAIGTVLITGGTGYIGSFTTLALLEHGYDVVIVDNLYNSSEVALDRIELISGRRPHFYKVDITDEKGLDDVFSKHPEIDSVIHFAALKAVGESGEIPLEYYRVNVGGSISSSAPWPATMSPTSSSPPPPPSTAMPPASRT
uniref:NAD-dependent epimerase/dehydratase domain-containing protein n=1 Tax=Bionectria ochroleuca TaxID=29856 RepID=A0A8H7KD45_BIOOC